MGSVGNKAQDVYFKTDWVRGTGPDSVSFKSALATGKRWMTRGYGWEELVQGTAYEYSLNEDEEKLLDDKLRMYAINNQEYLSYHEDWLDDFKRRGIKIPKRRTKIDKMLEEM